MTDSMTDSEIHPKVKGRWEEEEKRRAGPGVSNFQTDNKRNERDRIPNSN